MRPVFHQARFAILGGSALLLIVAISGCGNGNAAVPTEETARSALETVLNSWIRGEKPGEQARTSPSVVVHDTKWSQNEPLSNFEILASETEVSPVEKQFTVRLSIGKPPRTEEVTYHVLGVSPLMVFRHEDYLENINMEEGSKIIKTKRKTSGRR